MVHSSPNLFHTYDFYVLCELRGGGVCMLITAVIIYYFFVCGKFRWLFQLSLTALWSRNFNQDVYFYEFNWYSTFMITAAHTLKWLLPKMKTVQSGWLQFFIYLFFLSINCHTNTITFRAEVDGHTSPRVTLAHIK